MEQFKYFERVGLVDRRLQQRLSSFGRTSTSLVIVIVISELLKRYSKAKRTRAPAYSRALRWIKGGFPKGGQEKLRSEFQSTRSLVFLRPPSVSIVQLLASSNRRLVSAYNTKEILGKDHSKIIFAIDFCISGANGLLSPKIDVLLSSVTTVTNFTSSCLQCLTFISIVTSQ